MANAWHSIRGLGLGLSFLGAGCQLAPSGTSSPTARFMHATSLETRGIIFDAQRLHATGIPGPADQWDLQRMQAAEAWALRQGSDRAIVALIDTGIDLQHPQLVNKLVSGINITQPGEPPQDDLGHGTATAGIVGAAPLDGQGLSGVAPRARLMPVKVNVPGTSEVKAADAAAGITWAADHGANIINMSLGFESGEQGLSPAGLKTLSQAIQHALSKGVLVVCASGNIGNTPVTTYPALWAGTKGFEGLLAVGALDRQDQRASYSNFGSWLSLVAPADDIPALTIGGYGRFGGTSAAAPHVSGLAALLMTPSRPPSVKTLCDWMTSTTRDLGTPGVDPQYGAGCVNAMKAIQASSRY